MSVETMPEPENQLARSERSSFNIFLDGPELEFKHETIRTKKIVSPVVEVGRHYIRVGCSCISIEAFKRLAEIHEREYPPIKTEHDFVKVQ